eukprot:scaffold878_cov271-Pinguiococcus_pyrenoidosus.AAC.20
MAPPAAMCHKRRFPAARSPAREAREGTRAWPRARIPSKIGVERADTRFSRLSTRMSITLEELESTPSRDIPGTRSAEHHSAAL